MTEYVERNEVVRVLTTTPSIIDGKVFSARFVKKDGTLREGVFRLHVKKGVKGTGRVGWEEQTFADIVDVKGLVCVYDMAKRAFRFIPVERVKQIKAGGKVLVAA